MKYNTKQSAKTLNMAGGVAYKESDKLALTTLVLTSFMKDKFYESEKEQLKRIKDLVSKLDPLFVAKLAYYARTVYGMRSVSHVLAGEVAKAAKGQNWTRSFFNKIVYRPDDMGEILAYYYSTEKKLSNPIRDGFAKVLTRLSEYEMAKYRGEGKRFKLVDVANLCHPKNTDALKKLMKGELKSTETWEAKISQAGKEENVEVAKQEAWRDLVLSGKIGYFALLLNLRNISQQGEPQTVLTALELLTNESKIKKSLVLPFRFLTAIQEIQNENGKYTREIITALSKAMEISLSNVPEFDGKTLIALDCSASMSGRPQEIGSVFAAAFYKKLNADLILFSDSARYVSPNPTDSMISIAQGLPFASGGTNFHAIFQNSARVYDRIIILSDMQGWIGYDSPVSSFNTYKKKFDCDPFVYSIDLNGYGTTQLPTDKKVFLMAGFSDKIFDTMKFFEEDKNALINEIEKVEI